MISEFKSDLLNLNDSEIINKYYLSGSAFALDDNSHYKLRESVSSYFEVDYTQVFIVGSAKLGFSIKPRRRFKPFYDKSDIDIVVISSYLFDKIWKEVFLFDKNGGYWPKVKNFKNYHFQGWIRPDMLPLEHSFRISKEWWDFFERISGSGEYGRYRIRGGLYHSRLFFDSYQKICFDQCRDEVS
ncbi:MAG: hypothetical protein KDJ32_10700 [Alphaproteobacteria bacterium]|nr:hypothetical protein [Alphaproteobacteria bacterium]